MARKKTVKKPTETIQEKPKKKSILDMPVRDIFSFNVEKEIRDNADRSRNVVNNFGRQGITIIPRRSNIPKDDRIKLSIIILAGLFMALTMPSILVKGIGLIVAGAAGIYWIMKITGGIR